MGTDLIHVVAHTAVHAVVAAPAITAIAHGTLYFFVAATAAVVVGLFAFTVGVAAHALSFVVAAARRIVKKEHVFTSIKLCKTGARRCLHYRCMQEATMMLHRLDRKKRLTKPPRYFIMIQH